MALLTDDDTKPQIETDYLGRESPVSLSGQAALPVGGAPAGASVGPSAPSGAGAAPAVSPGSPTAPGPEGLAQIPVTGSSPSNLQSILGLGGQLGQLAQQILSGASPGSMGSQFPGGVDPELGEFGLPGAPGTELAGLGIPGAEVAGGELALGVGEGLGEAGGEALAGLAESGLGSIGGAALSAIPWIGALATLALNINKGNKEAAGGAMGGGMIGTIIAPGIGTGIGAGLGSAIAQVIQMLNGPSDQWVQFPEHLRNTLIATENANQTLAAALAGATDDAGMQAAIAEWKASIGQHVGGFGAGSDPWALPDVPGAGGYEKGHQGGLSADFSPEMEGLRALLAAAREGKTPQERAEAFLAAGQKHQAFLAEESGKKSAEREAANQYEDPAGVYNVGSA